MKRIIRPFHPLNPIEHALAAAGELLEAVYWTRTNGQQSVAAAALACTPVLAWTGPKHGRRSTSESHPLQIARCRCAGDQRERVQVEG